MKHQDNNTIIEKANKKIIEAYKIVEGNYRIRIRVFEISDLFPRSSSGYCNSFVQVSVFDTYTKKTKTIKKTNNPSFDETFYFELFDLKKEEFERIKIRFDVYDESFFGLKKDAIGSYELDFVNVYFNLNHNFSKYWFTLTDPEDLLEGCMGFIRADIEIVGPGDDIFIDEIVTDDPSIREKTIISDKIIPKGHLIIIELYYCESLIPTGLLDRINEVFIIINFGGFIQKSKIVKGANPHINQIIFLQTYLPNHSNFLSIEIWAYNGLLFKEKIIAGASIPFNSFKNIDDNKPTWINFYGPPLTAEGKISEIMAYNGQRKGSTYRGRLLARLSSKDDENPTSVTMDILNKVPEIIVKTPQSKIYTLRIDIYEGFELPSNKKGIFHFVLGPYFLKSQLIEIKDGGKGSWFESLEDVKVTMPAEAFQIPDLIIYFCDNDAESNRMVYYRLKPSKFLAHREKFKNNNTEYFNPKKKYDNLGINPHIIKFREEKCFDKLENNTFPGYAIIRIRLFNFKPKDSRIFPIKNKILFDTREQAVLNNTPLIPITNNIELEEYEFRCFIYCARNLPSGSDKGISNTVINIKLFNNSYQTSLNFEKIYELQKKTNCFTTKDIDTLKKMPISYLVDDVDSNIDQIKINNICTINSLNPNFFEILGGTVELPKNKEDIEKVSPPNIVLLAYHYNVSENSSNYVISKKDNVLLGRQFIKIDRNSITFKISDKKDGFEFYQNSIYSPPRWYPLIYDKDEVIEGSILLSFAFFKSSEIKRNKIKLNHLQEKENFIKKFKNENLIDNENVKNNEVISPQKLTVLEEKINLNNCIKISEEKYSFGLYLLGLRDMIYIFEGHSIGTKFEYLIRINSTIIDRKQYKLTDNNQLINSENDKQIKAINIEILLPKNKDLCPFLEIQLNKISNNNLKELIGVANFDLSKTLPWIFANEEEDAYKQKWMDVINDKTEFIQLDYTKSKGANKHKIPKIGKDNCIIFKDKIIYKMINSNNTAEEISKKKINKLKKKIIIGKSSLKNNIFKSLKENMEQIFSIYCIKNDLHLYSKDFSSLKNKNLNYANYKKLKTLNNINIDDMFFKVKMPANNIYCFNSNESIGNKIDDLNIEYLFGKDNISLINSAINYAFDMEAKEKSKLLKSIKDITANLLQNIFFGKLKINEHILKMKYIAKAKAYKNEIINWNKEYENNLKSKIKYSLKNKIIQKYKNSYIKIFAVIINILLIELNNGVDIFKDIINKEKKILEYSKLLVENKFTDTNNNINRSDYITEISLLLNMLLEYLNINKYEINSKKNNNLKNNKKEKNNNKSELNFITLNYLSTINNKKIKNNIDQYSVTTEDEIKDTIFLKSSDSIKMESVEFSEKYFKYKDIFTDDKIQKNDSNNKDNLITKSKIKFRMGFNLFSIFF